MEVLRRTAPADSTHSNATATEDIWVSSLDVMPELIFVVIDENQFSVYCNSPIDETPYPMRETIHIDIRDGQWLEDPRCVFNCEDLQETLEMDEFEVYTYHHFRHTEVSLIEGKLLLFEHYRYSSDNPQDPQGSRHVQSVLVPWTGDVPPSDWPEFESGVLGLDLWSFRDAFYPG